MSNTLYPGLETSFPDENTVLLVFTINPRTIAFLNTYVESFEGVGTVRTRDNEQGIVEIITTPDMHSDCLAILREITPVLTPIST